MKVSALRYRYSLDYRELVEAIGRDFDDWLEEELPLGVSEQRVDHEISELVATYVPSSPRQLLELAMQCELLLDVELEDPLFDAAPDDAYQALLVAVGRYLSSMLWRVWEARRADATALEVSALATEADGDGYLNSGDIPSP